MGAFDKVRDINLVPFPWRLKVRAIKVWPVPADRLAVSMTCMEMILVDDEVLSIKKKLVVWTYVVLIKFLSFRNDLIIFFMLVG